MKNLRSVLLATVYCSAIGTPTLASEQLMEKSGCLSCHRVDQKLIGPSFKEVAARYKQKPESVDYLLQKVRDGGEGEWGDIPMAANTPQKISDENLKLVIDWILSL